MEKFTIAPIGSDLSSTGGIVFDISHRAFALPSSPIVDHMFDRWNPDHYQVARQPLHVDTVVAKEEFSAQRGLSVLDMPIKFPGTTSIRVPSELGQFYETISKICDYQAAINPQVTDYYAYLTVDQRTVAPGMTQRVPGKHVDGIQGANVISKVAVEQTYIVSDALTTTAYVQPFDFRGKSVNTFNWFKLMEEQAISTAECRGVPYQIYLIDPYTVHTGTAATELTDRTFLRLEFSLREYDRVQNTHNPLFAYKWDMKERPVDNTLL